MKILFNRLDKQYFLYQDEYEKKALEILRSGWYILGPEVEKFESEFAKYIGTKYSLGIDNGLNALVLAFRSLNIKKGDEVLVQGNTFIASIMGITINEATPVFIEPDEYYNINTKELESKITKKTKAICLVHLYGQTANIDEVIKIAKKYKLYIIEDCAQSHGSLFNNKKSGTFGDISCFSFYPGKNLGCFGDGGAITTNNEELYKKIKILRNYGSSKKYYNDEVGYNARLDEIQAGLLRVKLSHLDELTKERQKIANKYLKEIINKKIELPKIRKNITSVWHLFVIKTEEREKLQNYLKNNGIETSIHYPIPPHLSEAYKYLGYKKGDLPITEKISETILSLPLYNGMSIKDQEYIIEVINNYD